MKRPAHPGGIIKHDCMKALGLGIAEAAAALGVSRSVLSKVVNGLAPVSPDLAIRFSKAFGSRPEIWLGMQMAYDLAEARRRMKGFRIKRLGVPEHQ